MVIDRNDPEPIELSGRGSLAEIVLCRHTILACVHGSTNGTNGRPISFKVLPMVPLVIPLVPLVKTDGSQYCRQSTVWAKLPTLESHVIKYGVLNFKFINFTNKHCFLSGCYSQIIEIRKYTHKK